MAAVASPGRRKAYIDASKQGIESEAAKLVGAQRELAYRKREDEVMIAEVENRLRKMVVDVMAPSIRRFSELGVSVEEIGLKLRDQSEQLQRMTSELDIVRDRIELVPTLQKGIDAMREHCARLEAKMLESHSETFRRVELIESLVEVQKVSCASLHSKIDRTVHDVEDLEGRLRQLNANVEAGLQRNHAHTDEEIQKVEKTCRELEDAHLRFVDEVWGSPKDFSPDGPLSLHRLDLQTRGCQMGLDQALEGLAELHRLGGQVKEQASSVASMEDRLSASLEAMKVLRAQTEKMRREGKQDAAKIANMTAACTANLMQDIRNTFGMDLRDVVGTLQDVDRRVCQNRADVTHLEEAVDSAGKHVEALARELHSDLGELDSKRRKDKQTQEETAQVLRNRVATSAETTEATVRGLEHLSRVISMSLQSERMSVALDLQDFVERKETPFVSVRSVAPRQGTRSDVLVKAKGINPDLLMARKYDPHPVSFQGTDFDRPKLLALREQLLHVAQEALQLGPQGQQGTRQPRKHDPRGAPAPLIVPQVTGAKAELPLAVAGTCAADLPLAFPSSDSVDPRSTSRSSKHRVARPGSRCQPAARGSSPLDTVDPSMGPDAKPQPVSSWRGSNSATPEGPTGTELAVEAADDAARLPTLRARAGSRIADRVVALEGRATPEGWCRTAPAPLTAR